MFKFLFLRKFKNFHLNSNFIWINPKVVAKYSKVFFLFLPTFQPMRRWQPILVLPNFLKRTSAHSAILANRPSRLLPPPAEQSRHHRHCYRPRATAMAAFGHLCCRGKDVASPPPSFPPLNGALPLHFPSNRRHWKPLSSPAIEGTPAPRLATGPYKSAAPTPVKHPTPPTLLLLPSSMPAPSPFQAEAPSPVCRLLVAVQAPVSSSPNALRCPLHFPHLMASRLTPERPLGRAPVSFGRRPLCHPWQTRGPATLARSTACGLSPPHFTFKNNSKAKKSLPPCK
jgi:hypothetical protein